jgi:Uncharacterized protein conserved in bacteria
MNLEEIREYCINIKGASESFPFDEVTLVFKVMDKMFAVIGLEQKEEGFSVTLKCDPDKALELRETYEGIIPAFHFNKRYWNSVRLEKDVSDKMIKELVNHSVEEVIKKLPKKKQEEYNNS